MRQGRVFMYFSFICIFQIRINRNIKLPRSESLHKKTPVSSATRGHNHTHIHIQTHKKREYDSLLYAVPSAVAWYEWIYQITLTMRYKGQYKLFIFPKITEISEKE